MPFVGIHHMAGAFTRKQQEEMIEDITNAFIRQGGEGIRPSVQISISETADGLWGVGGKVVLLEDIERRRAERRAAAARQSE